jgi:hypothetical protein
VGTGLIYAMVVGLWALFLLPMWLRSHERTDEGRQVDRFREAMTHLSQPQVEVVSNSAHKQVQAKRAMRAGSVAPIALSPAARRRRVLAVLAAFQALGMVASALGAGVLLTVAPALLIVGFLTLARAQVRREHAVSGTAPVTTAHTSSLSTFARALATARTARRSVDRTIDVVEQAPAAPTVVTPASWQPVRTPAPSYVSAPAATAVPRVIDAAGGWTGSAMVEAARAMAEQPEIVATQPIATAPVAVDLDITAEIPVIRHTA